MKRIILIIAYGYLSALHAFDPRVTALSLANAAKNTADTLLNMSNKGIAEILQGRRYQAIREELLANQKALKEVIDEAIDVADTAAITAKRVQIDILKATQGALVEKLRQQRFPLNALNKLIALLEAQFPALGKVLDAFDARESIIRGYSSLVDKVTMEGVNRDNPYRDAVVQPEPSTTLRGEEIAFRLARDQRALPVVEKLFGSKKAKIAFTGTGGGYRAMMLTLGYLMGLEAEGWFDTLYYISSLSGSTWFLAPWIYGSSDRVADYLNVLRDKIGRAELNVLDSKKFLQTDVGLVLDKVLWPKTVFVQPVGSVDIYGSLLASVLFSQFGERRQTMHLSEQWDRVKQGNKPFPLYTAVSANATRPTGYDWIEFNPVAVTNLSQKFRVPAYAFGSQFRDGKSVIIAPEQSMGYLLGAFGSAYAVNIKDLDALFLQKAKTVMTTRDVIKRAVLNIIFKGFATSTIGSIRALPADCYNPFRGYLGAPSIIRDSEIMTLIDAGIDYNIPILPLLEQGREINVIILGESSRNPQLKHALNKMIEDIKRTYGYHYVRIDDKKEINVNIFKADNPSAPLIIYVSFLDDPELLKRAQQNPALRQLVDDNKLADFDIAACLNSTCGTFNFAYSVRELEQLAATAEVRMRFHLPVIQKAIIDFVK